MKFMVLGFAFDKEQQLVLLRQKRKPSWQAGKLNGIGGKMESGETAIEAMVREFREETDVVTIPDQWHSFATLAGEDWRIFMFRTTLSSDDMRRGERFEEEGAGELNYRIGIEQIQNIQLRVIPNLRWLIPMAQSFDRGEKASVFYVKEIQDDHNSFRLC